MTKAKTAEEFDRRFDEGEDIFDLAEIDEEKIKRPGLDTKRINIDVPADFLLKLDEQATRRGVSRQSLIKVWLFERLQEESSTASKADPSLSTLLEAANKLSRVRELVAQAKETLTNRPKRHKKVVA